MHIKSHIDVIIFTYSILCYEEYFPIVFVCVDL